MIILHEGTNFTLTLCSVPRDVHVDCNTRVCVDIGLMSPGNWRLWTPSWLARLNLNLKWSLVKKAYSKKYHKENFYNK